MVKPTIAKLEMVKLTNEYIFYGQNINAWITHE
jgi:hypothetical protein